MSNAIEEIRISIEQKKAAVGDLDALTRLSRNRDWKRIIDTVFLKDEPARLVALLAHPGMQDEVSQKEIHSQMLAVAYLRSFLARTEHFGQQAKDALPHDEETEAELLKESVEG